MSNEKYSTRTFKVDCSRMTDSQLKRHIKAQKKTGLYKADFIAVCEYELKKREMLKPKTQEMDKENQPSTKPKKKRKNKPNKKPVKKINNKKTGNKKTNNKKTSSE